jgi:hypothetical protein
MKKCANNIFSAVECLFIFVVLSVVPSVVSCLYVMSVWFCFVQSKCGMCTIIHFLIQETCQVFYFISISCKASVSCITKAIQFVTANIVN